MICIPSSTENSSMDSQQKISPVGPRLVLNLQIIIQSKTHHRDPLKVIKRITRVLTLPSVKVKNELINKTRTFMTEEHDVAHHIFQASPSFWLGGDPVSQVHIPPELCIFEFSAACSEAAFCLCRSSSSFCNVSSNCSFCLSSATSTCGCKS